MDVYCALCFTSRNIEWFLQVSSLQLQWWPASSHLHLRRNRLISEVGRARTSNLMPTGGGAVSELYPHDATRIYSLVCCTALHGFVFILKGPPRDLEIRLSLEHVSRCLNETYWSLLWKILSGSADMDWLRFFSSCLVVCWELWLKDGFFGFDLENPLRVRYFFWG